MKILKRQEFLATPNGTVYQEYEPCVFGPMRIKYDRIGSNDFVVQDLAECAIESKGSGNASDLLFDAEENGTSLKMDFDSCGREGLLPGEDALYAVWEPADIQAIMLKLAKCL
ncbi:hypothetical protein [Pseudomonas sp.]|uniref:hypothetical protein n=1 Tax=Pseudomonas sp. TaxID=306 RepID=UPI003FD8877D